MVRERELRIAGAPGTDQREDVVAAEASAGNEGHVLPKLSSALSG